MSIKYIIVRAIRITLIPSAEWQTIAEEKSSLSTLFFNYSLFLIMFSAIGRTIGISFIVFPFYKFSSELWLALGFYFLYWTVFSLLLIIAITYILNWILRILKFDTKIIKSAKLVVYSFTPLFLFSFIIFIHPVLHVLIPVGILVFALYIIFILWYGIRNLFEGKNNPKVAYYIIAVIVIFLVFTFGQILSFKLLKIFFPLLNLLYF
ncbi:MAG: Yip1 family protein [Bacteroidales bacterium]|jgi:hypothetical protein